MSINVELPTREALADLAPQKDHQTIRLSMARIRARLDESREDADSAVGRIDNAAPTRAAPPVFAPAGQSTQMIIGADPATDAQILSTSANLYASYRLRRVYYSAFSPIPDPSAKLPAKAPPLLREHRLYQSDWLMRFYGYRHDEIMAGTDGQAADGMLSLDVDPKLAWAMRNRSFFPLDLNRASRAQMLRVPGLGARTVKKLLEIRRWQKIRLGDLVALRAGVKKALPFIVCSNHRPALAEPQSSELLARYAAPPAQLALSLF